MRRWKARSWSLLFAVLAATPALVVASVAAQAAARVRLAQSSTVTNCMMACNAQAANCQTTCLVPGSAPTGAATTTGNANLNTTCQAGCSTKFAFALTGQPNSAIDSTMVSIAFSVAAAPMAMASAARWKSRKPTPPMRGVM